MYDQDRIETIRNNNATTGTSDDISETYSYDSFERVKAKLARYGSFNVLREAYTYNSADQVTQLLLDGSGFDRTYTFTYDGNGNILSVAGGGYTTSYVYDSQNQLVRENNQKAGKTWIWNYDNAGNITSKQEYDYTTGTLGVELSDVSYGYGYFTWKDLLTSYDGKSITYDAIGNITNDANWSYSWTQGRQLSSMYRGSARWVFSYDADGMRTERSYGTIKYTYAYNGSQLSRMTFGDTVMRFAYGADGSPLSINYDGVTYYYVTNLQGDVIGILNSSGVMVVEYNYDAWGRLLSTTGTLANSLGMNNPLRYRGYVYDRETGLYYLQSRYYNPEWGRFINADGLISTGQGLIGNNMYAYCGNDPVNRVDPEGQFWKELWDAFTQTIQQASGYFAVAAGVSQVDTLVPGPADVVSGVLLLGGILVCTGIATYIAITAPVPAISIPKAEEKAEAIPTTPPSSTVIYRYGGTNPGNLTPKAKDKYSGLSFSTVPMHGAAVTTIEALNATGVVYAVQDGPTHVSVRPIGATTEDWINAGSGSIWTQAVKSVVIKWDGGY